MERFQDALLRVLREQLNETKCETIKEREQECITDVFNDLAMSDAPEKQGAERKGKFTRRRKTTRPLRKILCAADITTTTTTNREEGYTKSQDKNSKVDSRFPVGQMRRTTPTRSLHADARWLH
ncbi:hypothetical protein LY78DRAFT_684356 [Colletotrichum sublineola]|uniref:Putative VID27 cytoplasmic protein n=1 Tax=Colletotrichum sublineola TaxID=1173701 RepID=A0A066XCH4_COLSU|nr:hypothetical protein LY78DRAFT_684356 [Colletotrichum sublineola]KDN63466.1 putative VID27 cytoplasmic protein [Colletotrichum sublineola]